MSLLRKWWPDNMITSYDGQQFKHYQPSYTWYTWWRTCPHSSQYSISHSLWEWMTLFLWWCCRYNKRNISHATVWSCTPSSSSLPWKHPCRSHTWQRTVRRSRSRSRFCRPWIRTAGPPDWIYICCTGSKSHASVSPCMRGPRSIISREAEVVY